VFDQLRCIVIRYDTSPDNSFEQNENDTQFQVHIDDVNQFIISVIKLHMNPGINPHNKKKTPRIKMIAINKPLHGQYWWTSPDLTDIKQSIDTINQWVLDKHIYLSSEINKNFQLTMMYENEANAYAADPENFEPTAEKEDDSMQFDKYIDAEYQQFI